MAVRNTRKIKPFRVVQPEIVVCLFLVIATLLIYWQVRNFSFLVYDDGLYVTDQIHLRAGLTLKNIFWAFSSTSAANWHPLTWLSHMLDIELYGMNPGAHHMTSVLFHILNSLLLFLVFRKMTGKVWRSGLVAALFALHPLHVESVAWVAERKDVLSTFFWMLTLYVYAGYVRNPGLNKYLSVLIFFSLGLMAKPMLVTLPFVLLLLDFWPLKRSQFGPHDGHSVDPDPGRRFTLFKLVYEKMPLFALSAASSVVTLMVQQKSGAVASLASLPLFERIANASFSYAKYFAKAIWPSNLSVFYPPPAALSAGQVAGVFIFSAGTSLLVVWSYRKRPWLAVGWFWYLGTLIPVIGLVQVGLQSMADRYTYVPIIGLFVFFIWGTADLTEKWAYKRVGYTATVITILSALIVGSWFQIGYWANSITLFQHAIKVTSNNFLAHNALGNALLMQGRSFEAILHYNEALRAKPNYASAHYNLGHALALQEDHQSAIKHLRQAILLHPEYAEAHNYLGHELEKIGKRQEAIEHFRTALLIRSDYTIAAANLGRLVSAP